MWFLILKQLAQHVGEDVDGLRNLPAGGCERRGTIRHRRKKCAKDVRHRIDQKNPFEWLLTSGSFLSWHVFR
jgi:hypothetical protein